MEHMWAVCGALLLAFLTALWRQAINKDVPEAYLDEVFHVGQAQQYCNGHFDRWDPKITTPPGVYLLSWVLSKFGVPCDAQSLRFLNHTTIYAGIYPIILVIIFSTSARHYFPTKISPMGVFSTSTFHGIHTAINICLFPPLVFFSGLYYTDVTSTFMVLLFTCLFLNRNCFSRYSFLIDFCIFLLGAASLLFRQTNIFWVAVYPLACHLTEGIEGIIQDYSKKAGVRRDRSPWKNNIGLRGPPPFFLLPFAAMKQSQWFDRPIGTATLEDVVLMALTLPFCLLSRTLWPTKTDLRTFVRLWPYIMLILAFGGFVYLNGGVVLGDKSNHVATIHTPQLLYLWAFIFFFSAPLALPHLLSRLLPSQWVPHVLRRYQKNSNFTHILLCMTLFIAASLLAIHYNTIVHPFTLADNRHYVFYVFRLLLRHPAVKYLAAPVYFICALGSILALDTPKAPLVDEKPEKLELRDIVLLSWFVAWLSSTALCLVSAPLVEPRYYILPWIFWRLKVPSVAWNKKRSLSVHGDWTLWLETLWFAVINAWTMYMFLYRGFVWPQEPGNIQRFLW